MNAEKVEFRKFKSLVSKKEGIVCLGAGGDPAEWINGITDLLNKENIVTGTPEQIWDNIYVLTSTGGRTDLAFVSNNCLKDFAVGKMAIWRLNFGDCSWISDYVVNYAKHF
jgi:hypothetical protein